ncbi:MAG: Ig-like domain-containing protein [Gemmataceae bacterium]|nr:Ig-like domain-containing protein [Gemmataceae bacterium]
MRYLPLLLLVAGPVWADVRIEPGKEPTQVRVVAKLPAGAADKLPRGQLTQEQGEAWLKFALVNDETGREGVPMFGAYAREGDSLIFTPRFPLLHGHRYRAQFKVLAGKDKSTEYRVPARKLGPPATVEKIYPSGDVLPANHLRFRIHFSRPMRGGQEIFDQIRILDSDGEEIEAAWLTDELWEGNDCVLILYIHPGRIKYGLLLRELLGPVLEPDQQYTLVIGADMLDNRGQRLGKEVRKKFRTIAEERARIELSKWKVQEPVVGTKQPLTLAFAAPLDRGGLETGLKVFDGSGKEVAGRIEVGAQERSWSFHPAQPWKATAYEVRVDGELEDVAGNTPLRPFDRDLKAPTPPPQRLTLPFRPRPAAQTGAK